MAENSNTQKQPTSNIGVGLNTPSNHKHCNSFIKIDSNNFTINCATIKTKETNYNFIIDCSCNNEIVYVDLEESINYFGFTAEIPYISFISEFESNLYYGFDSMSNIRYDNVRLKYDLYFGFESSANVLKFSYIVADSYFGFSQQSDIVYDPRNIVNGNFEFGLGFESNSLISYEQRNELSEKPFEFGFGFATSDVTITWKSVEDFGAINPFVFGFENKNQLLFNPRNEFFQSITDSTSFNFGFSTEETPIRYNDDHNVYVNDFIFDLVSSNVELTYANNRPSFDTTSFFGFGTNSSLATTSSFVCVNGIGYTSYIKHIVSQVSVYFTTCEHFRFGFTMHDNDLNPKYFDLQRYEACCQKDLATNFLHIEYNHNDEWDIIYGQENKWGFKSETLIRTQPRFECTQYFGFESYVEDTSVYFWDIDFGFGYNSNLRNIGTPTNIDLTGGNIINDDKDIIFELTKPNDESSFPYYVFHYGWSNEHKTYFGMESSFSSEIRYKFNKLGLVATFVLDEEGWKAKGSFGFDVRSVLSIDDRFPSTAVLGFESTARFYESPYESYFGFESVTTAIITENDVEFLEWGEIINEHLFQTENGDIDFDRPIKVSIEGYPYVHKIKGRCY